ncbi:MAG TPA: enoyl-CoA hydratase-related protein, partial [Candidatus Limnocylindrales bacterium]|nr:enoyl-CoA hydratase-related protein [Candidatus Limnocylindrales bacterium]
MTARTILERSDSQPLDAGGAGLLLERDGAVAWLILDRPDRRNAIDRATRAALAQATAALEADPEVAVVILTGTGPAFCTGTDLK